MSDLVVAIIIGSFIISFSIGYSSYNYHDDLREIKKTISYLSTRVGENNDNNRNR